MENQIVPVKEIVEVEVKRREPQKQKTEFNYVREGSPWERILLDNVFKAMAKPRR